MIVYSLGRTLLLLADYVILIISMMISTTNIYCASPSKKKYDLQSATKPSLLSVLK